MTLAKPRDRRVIRPLIRRDHPEGDILHALALDHPRRTLAAAIGIEQQRDHHPRIVRRPTHTIRAIRAIERLQLQLFDRRKHEPRKMAPRQPIPQIRRQQQLLITITRNEPLGHTPIVLNPPDNKPNYATATAQSDNAESGKLRFGWRAVAIR